METMEIPRRGNGRTLLDKKGKRNKAKTCEACHRVVDPDPADPYKGHYSDCSWVESEKMKAEPVIWKLEIGSFRVRCRATGVTRTGRLFQVEAQTSTGYKRLPRTYHDPRAAFGDVTNTCTLAAYPLNPVLARAMRREMDKKGIVEG